HGRDERRERRHLPRSALALPQARPASREHVRRHRAAGAVRSLDRGGSRCSGRRRGQAEDCQEKTLNPSRYGWVVVAAAFTLMFVGFAAAYSFAAFFGAFAEEFGAAR